MCESAILTVVVYGILNETSCEVCAVMLVGQACVILLCIFIQIRPLLHSSLYSLLHSLSTMSDYINTTIPTPVQTEEPALVMEEVMYEVPSSEEDFKPMTCEEFLQVLRPHFDCMFTEYEDVIFDDYRRCHSRYFRDGGVEEFLTLGHDLGFEDCHHLADEVLAVVNEVTYLGVEKAFAIQRGESDLGLTLPYLQDRIFIRFGGCRHPFDIVGTTLHEVAHQMVVRTPHHWLCDRHPEGHCPVWRRCAKVVTAAFPQAPKSSPYLNLLRNEYGDGWEQFVVQGATACNQCGETVAERLMLERLEEVSK